MNLIASEPHARVLPLARAVSMVLVIALTVFLLLYHLSDYPVPWYDEGSHLHVAKNYALQGVYADSSSEGYRSFGPAIGVGPTVLLPIALLFKLVDVSIPLARLVIVVYSLLTLGLVYFIVRRFAGWGYALLAVVLILLIPSIRYLYYSRTVVGEVPGMFFFLAGLMLWLHPRGRSIPALAAVGVLIGLAAITKNQYAFFMLPGLLLNWVADLVWYKRRGWRYFVIPGVIAGLMFGGWLSFVVLRLGQGNNFAENLTTLRTAGMGALVVFDKNSIPRVVDLLADEGTFGTLFIPAFIYALATSWRRDDESQQRGILTIFLFVSTILFAVSLGWDRYAFGPVILAVVFVVLLIRDLVSIASSGTKGLSHLFKQGKPSPQLAAALIVLGWVFVAVAIPLVNRVREIATQGRQDAYVAAEWISANIPQSAVAETWEQELGVLTDNTLHFPPQIVLAYSVEAQWQGGEPASKFYDFREPVPPDYVIRGPFSAFTRIYPDEWMTDYEQIQVIGPYQIYQRRG